MSCMKKVAVSEPLVDCCERQQVCAKQTKFKEFDLYTVSLADETAQCKLHSGQSSRFVFHLELQNRGHAKRIRTRPTYVFHL